MIELRFFRPEDLPALQYMLSEIQLRYTATAEEALQRIKERNDGLAYPVTILYEEKAVGFFVLDLGDDKLDLTTNKNAILLRSLSLNPQCQGKGIGKAALLKMDDLITENFKDCDEIVLAVNKKNTSAYHLYLKTGYVDEGKTRIGRSGPQYLMYKNLRKL